MKDLESRKNELSPVIHRELFERCPTGIDQEKWEKFRNKYNSATSLIVHDSPAQLDIELNSSCNLKCSFCIQSVRDLGKYHLGWECYTRLIDEAIKMETTSLKLNYMNEPLIVQNLEKYIAYAKDAGMINIFFSTNGILLNEKRAKSLIESGLTKIFISLDATNAETFKAQRHSKKFNEIVQNVLRFIDIRNSMGLEYPLVRVNFLRNKLNAEEETDFIEFWEGKADMIIIQEMNELIDNDSGIYLEINKPNYKCSFPFKQLVVDARGRIMPCCCMNGVELTLGNVSDMSLNEAWHSNKMKEIRDMHTKGEYKKNAACRRCIDGK